MTRHPATEGNDLKPKRVDVQEDLTIPDPEGGRVSVAQSLTDGSQEESELEAKLRRLRMSEGWAPEWLG